jgi:putative acyl-CoA dehydrogenase
MSDLFLTLARTEKGLSCFLATGWLPDGSRNRLKLQRLKDKCGNKSNASSEVEFHDLHAVMLGDEGRGIRTIIEMAHVTRLDFAIGSSGLMRQALSQALHHTTHRRAFQRSLVDLPIMRNVVADLAVESEAMLWLSMRPAAALDAGERGDRSELLLSRIATPVAKYWACKRAPQFVAEALECHGGNGFIADHLMERLYREAPLNGIWEGTGNVICLDVLRTMQREPETLDVFLDEVRAARGSDKRLDAYVDDLAQRLADPAALEPASALLDTCRCRCLLCNAVERRLGPCLRHSVTWAGYPGHRGQSRNRGRVTLGPPSNRRVCIKVAKPKEADDLRSSQRTNQVLAITSIFVRLCPQQPSNDGTIKLRQIQAAFHLAPDGANALHENLA